MSVAPLPSFLTQGEVARLLPPFSEGSKERRAASIFLACLSAIPEYTREMLGSIGQRTGVRTATKCFTEVVFRDAKTANDRPDGLIQVDFGKRKWSAIVEVKIGTSKLEKQQIEKYIHLARANKIDAVVTISNQFAALPTHPPIRLPRSVQRGVCIYHWSWKFLQTQAVLLLENDEELDGDHRYLLYEWVRFLEHKDSGTRQFDQMSPAWRELVLQVKSGAKISHKASEVKSVVGSWHQEEKDLCLLLSREVSAPVSIKLPKVHVDDPEKRLSEDCNKLAKDCRLDTTLHVPDTVAPLRIHADLKRRTVSCSMKIRAPGDRKSTKARVNWVTRQLFRIDPNNISVTAHWPGRTPTTQASLEEIRKDPTAIDNDIPKQTPNWFEVTMVVDLAGKFSKSRIIIKELEKIVPDFYKRVGENLRAWVPPPPKIQTKEDAATEKRVSESPAKS